MNFANAIAKVRFASARPQRVILNKDGPLTAELLCIEPAQEAKVTSGQWNYYVLTAVATFTSNGKSTELPAGQFAASQTDEVHAIANETDQRLIVLAVGSNKQ